MPFGLANAPATFQLYINYVLQDYLDVFCIAYLDNIFIYSYHKANHMAQVNKVLEAILQHWLFGCLNKCKFHVKKMSFISFIITPGGVTIEPGKTSCIIDWPKPKHH